MTHKRWSWKDAKLADIVGERETVRFFIGVYEAALVSQAKNVEILASLGELYTSAGLYEKGLAMDRRLVALRPDEPVFRYNLACSLSLLEQTEGAFSELNKAIELGYDEFEHMVRDPDLENLRAHHRWEKLLETIRDSEPSG